MTTYSIETMHGDEICSGIQGRNAALESAKNHANRRSECVYLTDDDGGSVEVEPDSDD
jgi:hypothetical protein